MAFYSEAPKAITEKNPFPHTPAQHALLLHPLKARGRATVARILPQPVGWKEQRSAWLLCFFRVCTALREGTSHRRAL